MKHVVGFSGGIDSQATLLWVRNRFPAQDIIALNTDAGKNESPVTAEFIGDYSAKVFPITSIKALPEDLYNPPFTHDAACETRAIEAGFAQELTFEGLMIAKGRAPSPRARFCTTVLKLLPMRRWVLSNVNDNYEPTPEYAATNRATAKPHRFAFGMRYSTAGKTTFWRTGRRRCASIM